MIKKLIIGIVIFMILGSSFTIAEETLNNPPNIPSEPNPEDGASDIGIKTHLSWTGGDIDPGDKAFYDIYFGIESEPGLLATNIQMPNYNPGVLEKNTQYYWKVVSTDKNQAETIGPIWTFTTNDCDCNPPDKPSGPTKARNRYRYEYTTKITNQNQDGLYYNFSWGDGNYSGWLGPYNHNERVRIENQWEEPGEYQVQARARFQNNIKNYDEWITTGWSEPLIVTVTSENVENEPPEIPLINGPGNGRAGVNYDYTFTANDPDGDDVYIYVEFCEGCAEAQWHGPFPSGYKLVITHSWESQGTYTINAKAKDVYNAEGEWGSLEVSMPRTRSILNIFSRIMQRLGETFPNFHFFFI